MACAFLSVVTISTLVWKVIHAATMDAYCCHFDRNKPPITLLIFPIQAVRMGPLALKMVIAYHDFVLQYVGI